MADKYIYIAASGEVNETHTIVIDEKYVYHVANGELLKIPSDENFGSFRWIPPQKISLSFPNTMKLDFSRDMYFKIFKKKILFGLGATYSLDECYSLQDLFGLYNVEREGEPWELGNVICDANSEVGAVAYDDKIVIVDKQDMRKTIYYRDLLEIRHEGILMDIKTVFHFYDDPNNHFEKYQMKFENSLLEQIKSKIRTIHGFNEVIAMPTAAPPHTIVIYDNKLVDIDKNNMRNEYEYNSLFGVDNRLLLYFNIYPWDNPGRAVVEYQFPLPQPSVTWINEQIAKSHDAVKLINLKNTHFIKLYDDKFITYDKQGSSTEFDYNDLKYVEKNDGKFCIYTNQRGMDEPEKYSWMPPDDVISYINSRINVIQGNDGVKVFTSPTNNDVKFEFYKDKKEFRIRRKDKDSPMYPYSGILNYDVKEFDNSSSLLSAAILTTGALSGGINAISAPLYAQQNQQELSRIEVWLKINHNDEIIVEQVDYAHPLFAFNRSDQDYNKYQAAIMQLTTYIDEIKHKEQSLSNSPQPQATPTPPPQSAPAPQPPSGKDIIAELREWKELLNDGIISEEEFNAKKKQLMGL